MLTRKFQVTYSVFLLHGAVSETLQCSSEMSAVIVNDHLPAMLNIPPELDLALLFSFHCDTMFRIPAKKEKITASIIKALVALTYGSAEI